MSSENLNLVTDPQVQPSAEPVSPIEMQNQSFFKKWGGLVVLSLALAIIIIDTTLLNVSLKTIINDLNTDLKSMQWVITIYSLILASFTITGGRLGDLFGRKKMFVIGAIIFAIGSFLASISNGIGLMVIGEAIIEGIGAAMMLPATSSLLVTTFKGRDRAIAFGVWGGIAAASSAIGPILGGWLTTNYSWRWGFRINIFVVALVLLGSFLIREDHSLRTKAKIDFVGVLLSSLGLLSLVFGFIQASTFGWFKAKEQLVFLHHTLNLGTLSATPVFILLGLIILTAFIFWEKYYENKGKTPLLSLHLFKNKQFVAGASTMAVLALGQAGLFFTIPVFLQAVRHLDALHTGLTLLPMSISLLIAAPLSAFLIKYIRPKYLVQIGLSLSAIAFLVLRASLSVDSTAWDLAPGFIIFGFGMGLIMAQVSNLTLSAVSPKESGEASGVNNTLRTVGQTLGSAILGAVLLSALVSNVTTGIKDSKKIPDQAKQAIQQNIENNVSSISFGAQENSGGNNIPQVVREELTSITDQATVDANKTVMLYGLMFIVLGLLVSTQLSSKPTDHTSEDIVETVEHNIEDAVGVPSVMAAEQVAIQEEQSISSENLAVSKKTAKMLIATGLVVIAGLIILALTAKSEKDDTKDKTIVVQSLPSSDVSADANSASNTSDSTMSVDPNVNPPVSQQDQEPSQPSNTSSTASYSNKDLHFSFNEPIDWKTVRDGNGEVVFKSANSIFNIQSVTADGGDMDSLKTFLQSQSNIRNVTLSSFGTRSAYSFAIDGLYIVGYAFIDKGRLYYVLGEGSELTPLKDLTTF